MDSCTHSYVARIGTGMSIEQLDFQVVGALQDCMDACRDVATRFDWKQEGRGPQKLRCATGDGIGLTLSLSPLTDHVTTVSIAADKPVRESEATHEQVSSFEHELLRVMPRHRKRDSTSASAASTRDALEALSTLASRGIITDAELRSISDQLRNLH
jgi:hypothetical protein